MTSEERQAYFRAVAVGVYDKEPDEVPVPNLEWEMVRIWMDKGIPLRTVLQVLDQMPHPSIRYIAQAVEEEEVRRRRALSAG